MSKDINILVVDDNHINRQYFSMALSKNGYSVALAQSGMQAIEMVKDQVYNLIIMDMRMPEMDGEETARMIKNIQTYENIPIIAISAEQSSHDKTAIFNDYILKPISPSDLNFQVKKYCHDQLSESQIIFDHKKAMAFSYNDPEIMRTLIEMFIKDLPIQMELLSLSINSENSLESLEIIHKLCGSCAACGATELGIKLKDLSKDIKKENQSLKKELREIQNACSHYINMAGA